MAARKAAENREKEILSVAINIFAEKGFNSATTKEIAKEASVAEGTIFRYFKNKKEILNKVMTELICVIGDKDIKIRLKKVIEENRYKGEKEVLKAIFLDRINLIEKHLDIIKIVITEMQYHEDLREAYIKNIIMTGKSLISEIIEEGIKKGYFRKVDVSIVVRSFTGIIGMYILQKNLFPEIIKLEKEKELEEMVNLFLNGISKN